jgi:diguanylate cyclase (GGDEF)-like protein/PAS domain S-box-containing protein
MHDDFYKNLMLNSPFGYAYHRLVTGAGGTPVDYVILEVNAAFENLTGLKAADIVGRPVSESIPDIGKSEFNWFEFYGEVVRTGKPREVEQYSTTLGRWYKVQAYSPVPEHFAAIFTDITAERERQDELQRFFDINLDLLCIADTNGYFLKLNKAWEDSLGYPLEELYRHEFLDFVHPDDLAATLETMTSLRGQDNVTGFINRYRRADGTYRSIEWRSRPYGSIIYAAARDISEFTALQHALEREKANLEHVIEGTDLGTWIWNIKTGETVFNERWAAIIGYTLAELQPVNIQTWGRFAHPDDLEKSNKQLQKHFSGELPYYDIESRMRHRDGHWVWIQDRGKVIEWDADGKPLMMFGTHWEISDRKDLEEKLRESAIRDPLTRLYNRRHLFDRLAGIQARYERGGKAFSIAVLDLDHFKEVNDRFGHAAGDEVLIALARLLESRTRAYDLACRYGGEEFVLVSVDSGKEDAARRASGLLEEMRAMIFTFDGKESRTTFSCGVADASEFPPSELTMDKLIDLADTRCYAAKQAGRNRIVYG